MIIDTHAHINFKTFDNDADEVIRRSLSRDVWIIIVGTDYKNSRRGLELANKYEKGVYASIGLHPVHLEEGLIENQEQGYSFNSQAEIFNYDIYEKLAKFEKVVAIGETGLDYYHLNLDGNVAAVKRKQQEILFKHLELGRELNLPLIIHCRQAHDDMLALIKDFRKKNKAVRSASGAWGVMHCFSGDEDLAWQYFSLGLLISFNGMITFSKRWDDLIRKMPLEKLLVETDCPFLTPEPYRQMRNEPILVKQVISRIAEIRNLTPARVAEITANNARGFFSI